MGYFRRAVLVAHKSPKSYIDIEAFMCNSEKCGDRISSHFQRFKERVKRSERVSDIALALIVQNSGCPHLFFLLSPLADKRRELVLESGG